MSDQLNLDEPLPFEAYAGVLKKMIELTEADEPPEWGFFYLPPPQMMERFAQEHPAGQVCGVLAAPLPIHPNAWTLVESPVEIVEDFATTLESPRSKEELEISDLIRSGKPARIVGAWFRCEGYRVPQRLQAEAERRLKTGETPIDASALPDRVESQLGFAVDVWGRNYMASRPFKDGDSMFSVEDGDDSHCGRQRPNAALRRVITLALTPIPREPDLT